MVLSHSTLLKLAVLITIDALYFSMLNASVAVMPLATLVMLLSRHMERELVAVTYFTELK